jgi:hypothetical protein
MFGLGPIELLFAFVPWLILLVFPLWLLLRFVRAVERIAQALEKNGKTPDA